MYNVSADYRSAIHGAVSRAYITFTIDNVTYTEQNILQGSFNISNQCTGTGDITLGGVYVGVLNATLRNVNISRQGWRGKQIIPTFHFLVDEENDTWETVPLGVYTISKAEWKNTGIAVRAYDNMSLLDGNVFVSESEGDLYDYLTEMATACGITLAQTQQEFEALPNGDLHVTYYSEAGVETWRDLVSCIAQIIGGFATINRDGELLFVSYGNTAVDTIDTTERHTGGSFSDYKTKYTGFSVTFVETKETRTYFSPTNDGLTLALGANPFLQDESLVQDIADTMLAVLANMQYVPFNINMAANPVYDLGNVISFVDGLAGTASACCVQKWEFKLHKSLRLAGFGADPNAQDAKSKTDKQIVSLQNGISQISEQTLDFILPTTLSQSDIADNSSNTVEIFDFTASIENGKIDFFTCVQFEVETTVSAGAYADLICTITLTIDGDDIAIIEQAYRDGNQVLNINHLIEEVTQGNHTLVVTMSAAGGAISNIQFISAYLLTAKSIGTGTITTKDLFMNGDFVNNVLPDGLDKSHLTKEAYISGTNINAMKIAKATEVSVVPDLQTLSGYFLSQYVLVTEMKYGKEFYTENGMITRDALEDVTGSWDTHFNIPIKRLTGFNRIVCDARNTGAYNQDNAIAIFAVAIVNGVAQVAGSALAYNANDWVQLNGDISSLPYVDYIQVFASYGKPYFKNIKLQKVTS